MTAAPGQPARAWWLKTLYRWHWISSAIALLGMLLFAATGLTLNHAARIEAHPVVVDRKATVPAALLAAHAPAAGAGACAASRAAGTVALRSTTTGWASIRAAWFNVRPVAANSSMPTSAMAELIQCQR